MILRIKSMWKMIKYNMISLLLFEAGYRVATFLIITNLTSTAVNYSLKKRNFSYLTAENFHKFLQNPSSLTPPPEILLLILFLSHHLAAVFRADFIFLFNRNFSGFILFFPFLSKTKNLYQ